MKKMSECKYVYAVYDVKAGAYLNPFVLPNQSVAIRALQDCMREPGHPFAMNPSDYTLFQIGKWYETLGEFTYSKESIGCLVEFIPAAVQNSAVEMIKEVNSCGQ
jgi:hypothetical protein